MKTWMFAGLGLALAAGGVAIAQTPPAPPPPAPPGPGAGPGDAGPPPGREGWTRHGGMRMFGHRPPPPPTKAAVFRFRKGDQSVFIKCADDEPVKACVDAASVLVDKLGK